VASEHDACALVSVARKDARPTRAVLELVLHGMAALAHRSGLVDGEGDGAGVLTDIPRALWAHELERAGRDEDAVQLERFAIGHFFHAEPGDVATIVAILAGRGIETLLVRTETTDEIALGPRGRTEAPRFLQLALLAPRGAAFGSRALY
jgi:glutamate synthase (NADPH/NADH) large chain